MRWTVCSICTWWEQESHSPSSLDLVAPHASFSSPTLPLGLLTPSLEGSPKFWQWSFPTDLWGWAHSLPHQALPISFWAPSPAPGQRQAPWPISCTFALPPCPVLPDCDVSRFISEKYIQEPLRWGLFPDVVFKSGR